MHIYTFLSSPRDIFSLLIERQDGGRKKKERGWGEREKGREKHQCKGETLVGCFLAHTPSGDQIYNLGICLTENRTQDLSVCRRRSNQLTHTSKDIWDVLIYNNDCGNYLNLKVKGMFLVWVSFSFHWFTPDSMISDSHVFGSVCIVKQDHFSMLAWTPHAGCLICHPVNEIVGEVIRNWMWSIILK